MNINSKKSWYSDQETFTGKVKELTQSLFLNCIFEGVEFNKTKLSQVKFTDCTFVDCLFHEPEFNNCEIRGCSMGQVGNVMYSPMFTDTTVRDSTLMVSGYTPFWGGDVVFSIFKGSPTLFFTRTKLQGNIFRSIFDDRPHIGFDHCNVSTCDFGYKSVEEVTFRRCSTYKLIGLKVLDVETWDAVVGLNDMRIGCTHGTKAWWRANFKRLTESYWVYDLMTKEKAVEYRKVINSYWKMLQVENEGK